jgi:hypothetical protein
MANRSHPYSKPDQQGKLDGLCAVYSILNSIKLLYRVGEDDLDAMFRSLCESLPDKFPRALWYGLGVPEIGRLLNYSVAYLAEHHQYDDLHWRLPFLRWKFESVKSFWRCVGEQLSADVQTVVIIGLNKPWDHWTVAHKVTARAVEFFPLSGSREAYQVNTIQCRRDDRLPPLANIQAAAADDHLGPSRRFRHVCDMSG